MLPSERDFRQVSEATQWSNDQQQILKIFDYNQANIYSITPKLIYHYKLSQK